MMDKIKEFFNNLPENFKSYVDLLKKNFNIEKPENLDNAVIFGVAKLGQKTFNELQKLKIKVSEFSDNNSQKWGKDIYGVKIIPPYEIKKEQTVIIASRYVKDIYFQLTNNNINKIIPHYVLSTVFPKYFPNSLYANWYNDIVAQREIVYKAYNSFADNYSKELFYQLLNFRKSLSPIDLPEISDEEQYYPHFWKLEEKEIFIDVGAYNGDIFLQFLKHSNGIFDKYIAIEPDSLSYNEFIKNIPIDYKEKVITFFAGAGSKEKQVFFNETGGDYSKITNKGNKKINIITLDEICKSYEPTTIKMDVEGYEINALRGARKTISRNLPKLAISIYHIPNHLWQIPAFISKICSGYKFYLRHHEPEIFGTVLYVIK